MEKQTIIDILVSFGRRSDWSGGGRAICELEMNPQDFGHRAGSDESAYSSTARPKNDAIKIRTDHFERTGKPTIHLKEAVT